MRTSTTIGKELLEWGLLLIVSVFWGGSFFVSNVALADRSPTFHGHAETRQPSRTRPKYNCAGHGALCTDLAMLVGLVRGHGCTA